MRTLAFNERLALVVVALRNLYGIQLVVDWDPVDNAGVIFVDRIIVPGAKRGQGVGTAVMKTLIAFAHSENKVVSLVPAGVSESSDEATEARLRDYYARFGFVCNGDGSMLAKPLTNAIR